MEWLSRGRMELPYADYWAQTANAFGGMPEQLRDAIASVSAALERVEEEAAS